MPDVFILYLYLVHLKTGEIKLLYSGSFVKALSLEIKKNFYNNGKSEHWRTFVTKVLEYSKKYILIAELFHKKDKSFLMNVRFIYSTYSRYNLHSIRIRIYIPMQWRICRG